MGAIFYDENFKAISIGELCLFTELLHKKQQSNTVLKESKDTANHGIDVADLPFQERKLT
jgi:hypothetical protein